MFGKYTFALDDSQVNLMAFQELYSLLIDKEEILISAKQEPDYRYLYNQLKTPGLDKSCSGFASFSLSWVSLKSLPNCFHNLKVKHQGNFRLS
jgi:hypothetical protein